MTKENLIFITEVLQKFFFQKIFNPVNFLTTVFQKWKMEFIIKWKFNTIYF